MELPDWNPGPPGLYIHVPFCRSKCGYCSFYSVDTLHDLPSFLEDLPKEMSLYEAQFEPFDTLYIGGGTPSLIKTDDLKILFEAIDQAFPFCGNREVTIEVNPSDVDLAYLDALRSLGVNRLNIGVQSFNDRILSFLGRRHNAVDAYAAVTAALAAGFDNIGIDLIYGIPGQELSQWIDTLNRALSLNIAHLSCYQLTLEKGIPLREHLEKSGALLPSERLQREFFLETSDRLESAGYIHYEVSNFAKGEHRASRHNIKYWNHTPYLGLGPSAHSYTAGKRWWNSRSVRGYMDRIGVGVIPVESSETLTLEQLRLEALFLGLRTRWGIHLPDFSSRFKCDLLEEKREALDKLTGDGFLTIDREFLRPTRAGMAVADGIASFLFI
ncbi:MAG: radical SAM family heme chaperone HemW [Deltaproteobacteria bacterium]|nr:radical SAM family heme chaperone HemW [Deltaproteobacteria bacterium]